MTYMGTGMIEQLRYIVNYPYLTSKLIQYAQRQGIDPATWEHIQVERLELEKGWCCSCYAKSNLGKPRSVLIKDDGTLEDVEIVDVELTIPPSR
jgi:hypothetical protein